jgi:hypothetical protein
MPPPTLGSLACFGAQASHSRITAHLWRLGHNTVSERCYGSDATSRYNPKPNSTMPIVSSNRPKK